MRIEVIDIEKLRSNSGQIEGLPANPRKWDANDVKRLAKLSEEYGELQEAAGKISMHGYMSDEDKINVVDEVSDMCAVLGHIVHILGFDFTEMLLRAESKISGRIDNPDYMRRHPHTEDNN